MSTPTTTQMKGRFDLLKRTQNFLGCKESAIAAAKRGDREGARFWGQQARFDWSLIAAALAQPTL